MNYTQEQIFNLPMKLGGSSELLGKKFVYLSAEGTVQVATASTGALGLVLDNPVPSVTSQMEDYVNSTADDGHYEVGDALAVMAVGIATSKVESGKSVTVNDWLVVGANGYVQTQTDPSEQVVGRALQTKASTEEIKIQVLCSQPALGTEGFAVQTLSADGAITYTKVQNICHVTKTSAVAATLAAPAATDVGHTIEIVDQTGYAHAITIAAPGLNANTSFTSYVFTGNKGDSLTLMAMAAATPYWAVVNKVRSNSVQALVADGAITPKPGIVTLSKGSALAATLADPAYYNDGDILIINAITAQAHTVSNQAGSGFNGLGASYDVGTYGGAINDSLVVMAHNAKWYIVNNTNVTLG